jgi:hypothetical protein
MQRVKIIAVFVMLFSASFSLMVSGQNASSEAAKLLSRESKDETNEKAPRLIRVSTSGADSAEPDIASASDGSVYLIWVEHRANKEADVFLQKFNAERKTIGGKVRVNPKIGQATAWRGDPPSVKVGNDNTVYVGWTARVEVQEGSANDLYLSVSRDGGQTFAAPVKVNDDRIPADRGMHSMAIDKNNHIYFSCLMRAI